MTESRSLAKTGFGYRRGLADLGRGSYAWLQPDGSWGWSNAGLITDGEESLLVDTLFDLKLTREMLAAMRDAAPKAAARIGTLVNTHHNGDHCFGNELVEGAEIVANWIAACDHILGLDCETIVPGHGPVTDRRGVEAVRDYLGYIRDEARKRYDAERIAVNVATLYREFEGDATPPNPAELFALMGEIWKKRRG